jgi:pimeloyl-ACP methyl ester carboxylesterase
MHVVRKLLGAAVATVAALALAGLVAAGRSRPLRDVGGGEELPPPLPPGRMVDVAGRGEMFVREVPARDPGAPTVVLLHGWMYPGDLHWYRAYSTLGGQARLIAPDHRGHGRGPRPSKPFRLVDVADDVAALLRTLDAAPAIAVGYSLGGQVAQLLWRRHPDVVAGLVLCATSDAYNRTFAFRMLWRAMGILQVGLRLLPRHWTEHLLAAQAEGRLPIRISRMISPETPRDLTGRLPWVVGEFDRGSAEDVAEAGRELSRFDSRGWIGSVDVPTAVIVTTRDALVPPAWQRSLAERIPGAQTIELAMDHDGIVGRPELFLPALEKAIAWVHEHR